MLNIVLYQPEIPPNTGNIMRLAVNCDARLHLIHPLGFTLSDRYLRRAGLDYRELTNCREHANFSAFVEAERPGRLFAYSTSGARYYTDQTYADDDYLVFGPETRGLPASVLAAGTTTAVLRIPMQPGSRSLNLSNSVAIAVYEAWRQLGFTSLRLPRER
ncbi:MAG: tRNA (uridine(34)/cytosine(34)/5-carboxymethylaminomethyluridine(34)-2'-O)-methyltransferase TrmL [Thiotrichales bacterium]